MRKEYITQIIPTGIFASGSGIYICSLSNVGDSTIDKVLKINRLNHDINEINTYLTNLEENSDFEYFHKILSNYELPLGIDYAFEKIDLLIDESGSKNIDELLINLKFDLNDKNFMVDEELFERLKTFEPDKPDGYILSLLLAREAANNINWMLFT